MQLSTSSFSRRIAARPNAARRDGADIHAFEVRVEAFDVLAMFEPPLTTQP